MQRIINFNILSYAPLHPLGDTTKQVEHKKRAKYNSF